MHDSEIHESKTPVVISMAQQATKKTGVIEFLNI